MELREMVVKLNQTVNRLEVMHRDRMLGSAAGVGGMNVLDVDGLGGIDIGRETVSGEAIEAEPVVPARVGKRPEIIKPQKEKPAASLDWRWEWTYARNISQLLSNGMRHRADFLGLTFAEDGYVKADKFIQSISRESMKGVLPMLTADAIKNVIDTHKEEAEEYNAAKSRDATNGSGESRGARQRSVKQRGASRAEIDYGANEPAIFIENKNTTGKNDRHQYTTLEGELWIRCMNGHRSDFYGDGVGKIKINKIFEALDWNEEPRAYHDTKFANIEGIDKYGLINKERFVHLWTESGEKKGRKNMDVRYTVDVKAASSGGIRFWKAANGVVLVDGSIPRHFILPACEHLKLSAKALKDSEHQPRQLDGYEEPVETGSREFEYVGFYEIESRESKLMEFARDLLFHAIRNPTMKKLAEVLRASLLSYYENLSAANKTTYKDVSDMLESVKIKPSEVLVDDPRNIKLDLRLFYNSALDLHVVMPRARKGGKNKMSGDMELVLLGKEFGFPRGFPILWKQGQFIDARGFYPKFENDGEGDAEDDGDGVAEDDNATGEGESEKQMSLDLSIFEGATSFRFFKKWSGFLLHVIAFRISGKLYWTVFSKNYAEQSNVFIQRGYELMEPLVHTALLAALADGHMYLGGEALHIDDEHGYIAKKNGLVVTCVGRGSYFDWNADRTSGQPLTFTKYHDLKDVVEFCHTHRLQSDTSFIFRSSSSISLKAHARNIFAGRDMMRNSDFHAKVHSIQSSGDCMVEIVPGKADHDVLVGDVLEGFVLHITRGDGSIETKKVKLPFYTWRTLFLRKWLEPRIGKQSDNILGKRFIDADTVKKMKRFVKRWCHTHPAVFEKLIKCAAVKLQFEWKSILAETKEDRIAGRVHVIIADVVEKLYFSEGSVDTIDRYVKRFQDVLENRDVGQEGVVDICICLGPVGSGKSTFMHKLASSSSSSARYETVDGDRVFTSEDRIADLKLTLGLKSERNPSTLSNIWTAILDGKIPVISHGGGSFISTNRETRTQSCFLKNRIKEVFGTECRLTVVLMRDASDDSGDARNTIVELDRSDFERMINECFMIDDDQKRMNFIKKVARYRDATEEFPRNEWGPYANSKERQTHYDLMSKISKQNAANAAAICKTADHVFVAPYFEVDNSGWRESIEKLTSLRNITKYFGRNYTRVGAFEQIRAIVREVGSENICHITLMYSAKGGFEMDASQCKDIQQQLRGLKFQATRYRMALHPVGAALTDSDPCFINTAREDIPSIKKETPKLLDLYENTKNIVVSKILGVSILTGTKRGIDLGDGNIVYLPSTSDTECINNTEMLHVTETNSGFRPRDSVEVINFIDNHSQGGGDSFKLGFPNGGRTLPFESGPLVSKRKACVKLLPNATAPRNQEHTIILPNYEVSETPVEFECLGVAFFRHADAN